jgi:hypothetical protein
LNDDMKRNALELLMTQSLTSHNICLASCLKNC